MPLRSWFSSARCSLRHLLPILMLGSSSASALELQNARSSPFDLAVSGQLAGVPAGETRYVRWDDLRKLPVAKIVLPGEFGPGDKEITALMLSDLWSALPCLPGADTLLATCKDGYAAIYRQEFVAKYRPFLVLEINGTGPGQWPPPGLKFNPGPYVVSVSPALVPGVKDLLDAGHKRPWTVAAIEVANFSEREQGAFSGKWASLSPAAQAGREIWINSCASCHQGPGKMFGGIKADRPFEVIAAHAAYNQAYFRKYVRNPQAMIPGAKMEAHPHYSDEQLDELIAFITADGKP